MNKSPMLLLIVLSWLMHTTAYSQCSLKGNIKEIDGQPVSSASIQVFKINDPRVLATFLSDSNGTFKTTFVVNDSFYIQVTMIGFEIFISNTFPPDKEIDAGLIQLSRSSQVLTDVQVNGKNKFIKQKIDRTIINIQESVMSKGNSILTVLSKSPSVNVNMSSGDISLLGKSGVLILMDDKPLRLERQDLINYLANLPADNIATIELLPNPPANYDAQGAAGIINITTVKKRSGFTGQLSPSIAMGKRPKFGNAINLHYRKGKLYSYANINTTVNYDLEKVNIKYESEILNKSSELDVIRKPRTGLYTADIGIEWGLSKRSTIGANVSFLKSDWQMNSVANATVRANTTNALISTHSFEENKLSRSVVNLFLKHQLNKRVEWQIDLDKIDFKRKNPTYYKVTNKTNNSVDQFYSNATTPLGIYVVKSDLRTKLSDQLKIDIGGKLTMATFDNDVNVANEQNGTWLENPSFKNNFQLEENVYAGYVNMNWALSLDLAMQAGLRYEHYDLALHSLKDGNIVNRSIGNLFPSIFMSYKISSEDNLTLSFANRIQRPGFLILAPYFYFFDEQTLSTGNPTILPSRTNQLQINYTHKEINLSLQYNRENLPVLDFQPTINQQLAIFEIKPIQGIQNNNINMNLNFPLKMTKWWSGRINAMGNYNRQKFMIGTNKYDRKRVGYDLSTTQRLNINKIAEVEVAAGYYSANIYGTLDVIARHQVDIAIRKKLNSGVSLVMNVNDLLNTGTQWPNKSNLNGNNLNYYFNFDAEGTVLRFSMTIPLGKNKSSANKSKHENGSTEELNRIR